MGHRTRAGIWGQKHRATGKIWEASFTCLSQLGMCCRNSVAGGELRWGHQASHLQLKQKQEFWGAGATFPLSSWARNRRGAMSAMAQLVALQTDQGDPCNFVPNVLLPDYFLVRFLFCFLFPVLIHGQYVTRNVLWQGFPWADGDKPKANHFLPLYEFLTSSFHHTPSL